MRIDRHYEFWPKRLPKDLAVPQTSLFDNLEISARRYPDKIAIHYYGGSITYRRLKDEAEALAGYLQTRLGIKKNDRVLLIMQNSPQFIITYYGVLRANAVVVPLSPMNVTGELEFYIKDCRAKAAIVGQELYERIAPLQKGTSLQYVITAAYSEYASPQFDSEIPEEVWKPRQGFPDEDAIDWQEAISAGLKPGELIVTADDTAVLPYTSGTTGIPKGCLHTHGTVNSNTVGAAAWGSMTANTTSLVTLPLFHVTGMQHSMNAPVFSGGTMVLLTRWQRDLAAALIERFQCTHWVNIATMVVDFLANPHLNNYNIQSLSYVGGGGAPLPEAVGERLFQLLGVRYIEGYGLSETISQAHFNPPDRPKLQCIGIPSFNVDARIIDLKTFQELGPHEIGELVVHGPQVMKEYWERPEETQKAFITIDEKEFFRTGDICQYDEEGYFFIVDRIKRMINASGFKVWPTEVESVMFKHPSIQLACVVGVSDAKRGETVKAYVVLHEHERGKVTEEEIINWSKTKMSSYKYPRIVEFAESLPMSASGKVLWRQLQEKEKQR
ncbi:acyl-CoA synthetase (AMP-forming)/AMP-acid ligase II [Desulfosporosinus orientis DSM 765]|uniref:Acyl-CoA synthetase (AMP-forming)/AMP-acid ligase II n=1 Tax=Desulfosporosinus orientis (strain ATCC 19365 / DSM 765 / NCIMB 8382 / VKM B-1628 / Singapore I) TaxID=768706 RepID=G7W947_DESOD|nr:long-chain fatty acid--CoA ligase [Desulfosporosinus orientis]AET68688.1 acyl-CoA synthetase (AMP-forming)/AMP-acid ligase II [Desulfosporosinus orientis DSM 765]